MLSPSRMKFLVLSAVRYLTTPLKRIQFSTVIIGPSFGIKWYQIASNKHLDSQTFVIKKISENLYCLLLYLTVWMEQVVLKLFLIITMFCQPVLFNILWFWQWLLDICWLQHQNALFRFLTIQWCFFSLVVLQNQLMAVTLPGEINNIFVVNCYQA